MLRRTLTPSRDQKRSRGSKEGFWAEKCLCDHVSSCSRRERPKETEQVLSSVDAAEKPWLCFRKLSESTFTTAVLNDCLSRVLSAPERIHHECDSNRCYDLRIGPRGTIDFFWWVMHAKYNNPIYDKIKVKFMLRPWLNEWENNFSGLQGI